MIGSLLQEKMVTFIFELRAKISVHGSLRGIMNYSAIFSYFSQLGLTEFS